MNPALVPKSFLRWRAFRATSFVAALAVFAVVASSGHAQGTMTYTFDNQPRGTVSPPLGTYTEGAIKFSVIPTGGIYISGGGIPGYPDNGTGYMEIPDAFVGGGGMTMGPTNMFPATAAFNLSSFDAAVYADLGPQTLEVVGYKPMAGTVTNIFTITGQTFQTFNLDSSFTGVFRVNFLDARFSLDNVVLNTVPEPGVGALFALGCAGALFHHLRRHRRRSRRAVQVQ